MRTRSLVVAALLVTASLAGCIGMGDDSSDSAEPASTPLNQTTANETNQTDVEPEDTGPAVNVTWHNGSVQGTSIPALGAVCYADCASSSFGFNVTNSTTSIMAEVAWNASTTMQLDLDIPTDKCDAGANEDCPPESTSGESVLVQKITNPQTIESGEWSASVFAENSPSQSVEFTVAISTFQGDPIPRDYGKLG